MYGVGDSEEIERDMNRFPNLYETQTQNQTSALMRNRSAPSSFFAGLLDGTGAEDYLNPADTETIFAGFVSSDTDSRDLVIQTNMKHENIESSVQGQKGHFQSPVPPRDFSVVENLNKVSTITGNGNGNGNGNGSNLIRQNSSPAGFFANLSPENARGVGNFRANNKFGLEANSATINLSNHMNFSSGSSSSTRFMPQIAENGHESVARGNTVNGHLGDVNNDTSRCYLPTIPNDSWNESTFTGLKRSRDDDLKMFSSLTELENGDSSHYAPGLVHHLSLPSSSSIGMAAVEKYLQFEQDAVPCKIRAKRGFATHPRSIAERVRRTRISQRMRKLQELFPDMDKQANTADMLDLAVEFIKDLQKEVQILKESRAKCTCSVKNKASPTG